MLIQCLMMMKCFTLMLYTGAQYVSRLWVGLNYYEIYFTSLFYVQHLQLRYRNDRSLQPRKPILYYLSSKIQANTRYNRRILLAFIRWVSRVNVVNERAQKRRKLNYIRFRSKLDLTKQISITHWSRLCASFIIIESLNY